MKISFKVGGLRGIISCDPGAVCQAVQFLRSLGSPFPNRVIAYKLSLFVCICGDHSEVFKTEKMWD